MISFNKIIKVKKKQKKQFSHEFVVESTLVSLQKKNSPSHIMWLTYLLFQIFVHVDSDEHIYKFVLHKFGFLQSR